ncbi:hypothetical protein CTZ28_18850 [Streptomyces shenzhenensis]|uniref:Uncharacterized protein n=1 Tax=Streptomyces shenzhenensis TaxID=943815 RepID=A0A3M0I7R3_9ACTN|nr:hypothetical protein CTZ28_18850 [Streptomyces shenzhenensis]
MTGSTVPPVFPRAPLPAEDGPGNEKTPRGCERSARGSRTTVATRTWSYVVVTADRRACCQ